MLKTNTRYGYNDVMIQPAVVSDINHRSECNPYIEDGMLPIFTAPMSTVVDTQNYDLFYENHLFAILPRNINWEIRKEWIYKGKWVAVSLGEFEDFICKEDNFRQCPNDYHLRIVIDVANGHMKKIFMLSCLAKTIHGNHLEIMSGNIANPKTYDDYCGAYIDYVRVGIGGGAGCITSSNTGIHDGIASLLYDINSYKAYRKANGKFWTKVIADGGIRGYADVIKALALGADYVMIGSVFAQCMESAGEKTYKTTTSKTSLSFNIEIYKDFEIDKNGNWSAYYADEYITALIEELQSWKYNERIASLKEKKFIGPISVKFFGMASSDGQKSISGEKTKTAEGITKYLPVLYTLNGWTKNMISYLRSAMSYCNITDVKCFTPTNVTVQVISNNTVNSINK